MIGIKIQIQKMILYVLDVVYILNYVQMFEMLQLLHNIKIKLLIFVIIADKINLQLLIYVMLLNHL